jgi:DNA-binding NarL/FixJ family response regulator
MVLDLSMPVINGIEATRLILATNQKVRIIIFSLHESNGMLNEARRAGAQGYVRKSQASKDLLKAIETVSDGIPFFNTQQMGAAC